MTVNHIEKIEAFLDGNMDPEAQKSFERELETDAELFATFNTYRAIESQMVNEKQYSSEPELKNTLNKLNNTFFNATSSANTDKPENTIPSVINNEIFSSAIPSKKVFRIKNNQLWKLAAAVFLGFIATGIGYLITNKKNTEEQQVVSNAKSVNDSIAAHKNKVDTVAQIPGLQNPAIQDTVNKEKINPIANQPRQLLYARYFVPDTVPMDKEEVLTEAYNQYERKQYANAAATFEEAAQDLDSRGEQTGTDLTKFYAAYYNAISYMAIGRYRPAIRQLKNLSVSDSPLKTKAQWYLALAYLRTGDGKHAILLLQTIHANNTSGEYGLKADRLLVELKSNK